MKNNHKDFAAKRCVLSSVHISWFFTLYIRGLEAMLQKRKRLLMYLRRTKYDNYSMLITRLGLKDTHMRMVRVLMTDTTATTALNVVSH